MPSRRSPKTGDVAGPLRFGPLALLFVATVTAAVAGIANAPSAVSIARRPASTAATPPTGPAKAPAAVWSRLVDGLNLDPAVVSCPSTTLCVFTGGTPAPTGGFEQGVSVSTGPFVPGARVTGRLTALPGLNVQSYVSCPSTVLCVLSTAASLYATTSPVTGPWVRQLSASSGDNFAAVSCVSVSFCAVVTQGGDVLTSTDPAGGAGAWARTPVAQGSASLLAISCPTAQLCVVGGEYKDGLSGWIGASTNPGGGSSAWSGAVLVHPVFAQGPAQYAVTSVSCPTTAFCMTDAGELLVSVDPTGGPAMWRPVSVADQVRRVAHCGASGSCVVSGVGTVQSIPGAPGPGLASVPQFAVSCVTVSFCVSVDPTRNYQIEVGGIAASSVR
jgi:hypothetical protein